MQKADNIFRDHNYYKSAREWYYDIYYSPISERSILIAYFMVSAVFISILLITIADILPIVKKVKYSLVMNDISKYRVEISEANSNNNSYYSIADIFIRMYIKEKESYEFENLENQINSIRSFSSEKVFQDYISYMTINNPNSPVLRYQKKALRSVKIVDVKFTDKNTATVIFKSYAQTISGEEFENIIWGADIKFNMDEINLEAKNFKFIIEDYKLYIIEKNQIKH